MRRPAKLESIVAAMLAATLATAAAGEAEARRQRGSSARPDGPAPQAVRVEYNVMVPMRDGVRLSTDVYRPEGAGPFPVILTRDPCSNGDDFGMPEQGRFWTSHGYVFLHQDARGRFDSGGSWYPFVHEGLDGADACAWAARQPWSTGRVATGAGPTWPTTSGSSPRRAAPGWSPSCRRSARWRCTGTCIRAAPSRRPASPGR